MAILNFLKKKKIKKAGEKGIEKKEKKENKGKEKAVKKEKEPRSKQDKTPKSGVEPKRTGGKGFKDAHLILASPHIAEKSTQLYKIDQYVFKVYPQANKTEIKKSIESVYGVNVLKVRTSVVPRRKKRLGKTTGWQKGYKKAIVTIKKGQEIEIMPR